MECTLKRAVGGRPLIAAHRGVWGGNVAPNTIESFEAALKQGADILELDVLMTVDNRLVVFHKGMEKHHLGRDILLDQLTEKEALSIPYVNVDGVETKQTVAGLDTVLERFKGRCFLNIDQGWDVLELVVEAVKRHDMQEQILLKSPPRPEYFDLVERYAPDYMYMPIINGRDECSPLLEQRNIRYIGAELVFSEETDPVADEGYLDAMHEKGRVLWGNGIVYNDKVRLSAGHSDDRSILYGPEEGWGWLRKKGFDIIQTDWPGLLKQYLDGGGEWNGDVELEGSERLEKSEGKDTERCLSMM